MIEGYAILYNVYSTPLEDYECQERILPGCFAESIQRGRTLRGKRIVADLNHDKAFVLGRIGRGLELEDRPEGVWFRLRIPLLPGIRGMSFSFSPLKWRRTGGLYTLEIGDLKSISVLTNIAPAYPGTLATIRQSTLNADTSFQEVPDRTPGYET